MTDGVRIEIDSLGEVHVPEDALYGAQTQRAAREEVGVEIKEEDIVWHNVEDWGIEGKGWNDTSRYFDRLPSKAVARFKYSCCRSILGSGISAPANDFTLKCC